MSRDLITFLLCVCFVIDWLVFCVWRARYMRDKRKALRFSFREMLFLTALVGIHLWLIRL